MALPKHVEQGAEIALTYQGDAMKKRVEPLADQLGALSAGHCDVTDEASVDAVFALWKKMGQTGLYGPCYWLF